MVLFHMGKPQEIIKLTPKFQPIFFNLCKLTDKNYLRHPKICLGCFLILLGVTAWQYFMKIVIATFLILCEDRFVSGELTTI